MKEGKLIYDYSGKQNPNVTVQFLEDASVWDVWLLHASQGAATESQKPVCCSRGPVPAGAET